MEEKFSTEEGKREDMFLQFDVFEYKLNINNNFNTFVELFEYERRVYFQKMI